MKAVVERCLPPLSFTRLLSLVANVEWLKKLWRGIQTDNGPRLKPYAAKSTLDCYSWMSQHLHSCIYSSAIDISQDCKLEHLYLS